MNLLRSGSDWEVRAPAKLNLLLEVLAKRTDGYHEVETLMVPIDLFDTLYFRVEPGGDIRLACQTIETTQAGAFQLSKIPEGADNAVVKAVRLLRERSGTRAGAAMRLVKRIPVAAGLGGGSSDAAAALAVANRAWDLNWPSEQLGQLAAELGSDVPFFLASGSAVCRGRGEMVQPTAGIGRLHMVLASPEFALATENVYRDCRPADRPRHCGPLVEALRRGAIAEAGRLMYNRLQTPATALAPAIDQWKRVFENTDCLAHQLTGSGSSYFGLCRSAHHARCIAGRLRSRGARRVSAVTNWG